MLDIEKAAFARQVTVYIYNPSPMLPEPTTLVATIAHHEELCSSHYVLTLCDLLHLRDPDPITPKSRTCVNSDHGRLQRLKRREILSDVVGNVFADSKKQDLDANISSNNPAGKVSLEFANTQAKEKRLSSEVKFGNKRRKI